MPAVLLRLHPPRADFPADATLADHEAMARHAAWWQRLTDAGQAVAVGPVLDPAGVRGLALVTADSAGAALRLVADDPVIAAGLGFRHAPMPMGGLIVPRR